MPGQFPQYVRASQLYAPVQNSSSGQGEKLLSLATSPTLMNDGLPSTELDRMTMILSDRLREVIERGTLLSIFMLMLKTYINAIGRDSPGIRLVWGISLLSFMLAVMLSIFVPLIQTFADAFGRPIPNEYTKWIYRPAVILTGTLLAQGMSLLFYLVIAAVYL